MHQLNSVAVRQYCLSQLRTTDDLAVELDHDAAWV